MEGIRTSIVNEDPESDRRAGDLFNETGEQDKNFHVHTVLCVNQRIVDHIVIIEINREVDISEC